METLSHYLNPVRRLGKRKYSVFFPLIVSVLIIILSEVFAMIIMKNPNIVGLYIIWLNVATIMYFAFRDGLRGGVIAAFFPIVYYFYIIYTRHHSGQQLIANIETTIVLGILFFAMAGIIGWLKETIDKLIESESDGRRRLETIVEQLPVGVTVTDSKGRVTMVNKKIDSLLGVTIPKGFVIGNEPLLPTTINGKTFTPSQGPLAQVLYSGKTTASKDFIVTRKDGKELYLQTSASAIYNKKGKLIAAASITNDLTQQKELEKRKDDFVNMASHELKTPITSMKLYIDSLMARLDQHNDQKSTRTLAKIKEQTERLQGLVNDLLDVSRLQTGKLSFTKEIFRIDTLVNEAVNDLQGMAKNQKIVFSSNSQINVYADKFRIYQVLTNLITNAVKYSPNGKQIKVTVKRQKGKAVVSIQDSGIGIDKAQQKKIFDRLYQVKDDKEKTFPGFGMGLYISKEIITRHKGKIWVESEGKSKSLPVSKQGSKFYFTLPLKRASNN